MSHFTQRQCDFAVGVTKTAMFEGLDRERLLELIGTAWDVLNSKRETERPFCEKCQGWHVPCVIG